MDGYVQVITTAATEADVQAIATAMVEQRLAGCGQVLGPITSTYWWEGAVETSKEWMCILKSSRDRYEQLEQAIRALHPYDEPEILAVPIVAGSAGYLAWLAGVLRS